MSALDDILARGSSLTAEEENWNERGLCACGHSHMSHHLKEPHRCNGEWVHPNDRGDAGAAFQDCACPGFKCAELYPPKFAPK